MAGFKDNALERRNASTAAKQALLEKFKAAPTIDDPAIQQRLEERRKIAEAREARMAERKIAQEAEKARLAVLKAEEEAAQRASEEEQKRREAEQAEREELAKLEKKAVRDARYAARKARLRR